jgi:hypothetical protein
LVEEADHAVQKTAFAGHLLTANLHVGLQTPRITPMLAV